MSSFFRGLMGASIPLSLCVSLPTFYRRNKHFNVSDKLYTDEDGETTQEDYSIFMRNSHRQIAALLIVNVIGLTINITAAILICKDLQGVSDRLRLLEITFRIIAASLLAMQGLIIAHTPSSIHRQGQGMTSGISCVFVYSANIWYDTQQIPAPKARLSFLVLHCLLLAASASISFTIPRRPSVFRFGRPSQPVDKEGTVSIVSRLTLSWANPKLSYALRKGGLDFQDLSYLRARMSAQTLVTHFTTVTSARLWKTTLLAHRSTLCWQWLLTFIRSFAILAPQYFMYRLIMILERDPANPDAMAAVWLALLGLAQLFNPWVDAWVLWIGWCHVALPVNMQLSGLIMEKSMRKKDVLDIRSDATTFSPNGLKGSGADASVEAESVPQVAGEESPPTTGHDEINLISVDAQRISDFLSYNGMFMGTTLGLAISLFFLLSLIRLQSILIGLAGISLFVPLNMFAKRRYSTAQNQLMNARDLKTATVTEALQGIRQVKFDALEPQWFERIRTVRNIELSKQWKAYVAQVLLVLCWVAGPTFFAAIALSTHSVQAGGLSPAVAFTSLAIFQRLESTLNLVPELLTDFINAWVSFGRIELFLNSLERVDNTVDADVIALEHASISWSSDVERSGGFLLSGLDFAFPKHTLSVIVGSTGAGKSLLLQAIIGEADVIRGTIRRPRKCLSRDLKESNEPPSKKDWIEPKSMAFVAQTAWIENTSLRDNILFGLPFSQSRYVDVLEACALMPDVAAMEERDLTEIGSHGVNLSGGQRSRLTLARAIYSRAEIIVMDDVLSAIDAQVGRHILEHALTGEIMRNRTCIMATHHTRLCLPRAGFVVMLDSQTVKYAGPPSGLRRWLDDAKPEVCDGSKAASQEDYSDSFSDGQTEDAPLPNMGLPQTTIYSLPALERSQSGEHRENWAEKERREKGRVKSAVYKQYLRAASSRPWTYWSIVIFFLIGFEITLVGRSWWVKAWSETYRSRSEVPGLSQTSAWNLRNHQLQSFMAPSGGINDPDPERNSRCIAIYFGIAILVSLLGTFKFFWVYVGSIRASRTLFSTMTTAVLHAPMHWLDTVPIGRILNRFIADFNVIDSTLANNLVLLLHSGLQLVGISIIGAIVSPYMLLCVIPLIGSCVAYAKMYLAGARDVKRLESVKKSPIFEQLGFILSGRSTIRAWNRSQTYIERMYDNIDNHGRCVWHLWLFNRWLGIRFALIGAIFTTAVAAFAVYDPRVSASLAGLALAFSLDFTDSIFWVLRRYADVEMDMNSLERVSEFCAIPAEPRFGATPPAAWPSDGAIDVSKLSVGYSLDSPPALQGVSFSVSPGSRVGVIGRTGAGKSSLTLAFFRFLAARTGCIIIDGIDISTLSLASLRSRLAIIPQHPFLWLGTVRSNLDPLGNYTDEEINSVLQRVNLTASPSPSLSPSSLNPDAASVASLTLNTPLSSSAQNISLGQRQLLSLARALLKKPKILIMDEATSAVDMETDTIMQRSIREGLGNCTLIVIAHRLSTIRGFDKVVVLDGGRLVDEGGVDEVFARRGVEG